MRTRWRIPLFVLITTVSSCSGLQAIASDSAPIAGELITTMTDATLSWEDRCAAENALGNCSPTEVLVALFPARTTHQCTGPICNGSGSCEGDSGCSVDWQISYAIGRVWESHCDRLSCEERRAALLPFLPTATTPREKLMLAWVCAKCWVPELEPVVADVFDDQRAEFYQRTSAGTILLDHGVARDYYAAILEHSKAGGFEERGRWFDILVHPSCAKQRGLDPRVVRIGFDLILEEQSVHPDYPHGAYFIAMNLEGYLGVDFQPDQNKPEYRGECKPKDAFFSDTVANALAWWDANKQRIEAEIAALEADPKPPPAQTQ